MVVLVRPLREYCLPSIERVAALHFGHALKRHDVFLSRIDGDLVNIYMVLLLLFASLVGDDVSMRAWLDEGSGDPHFPLDVRVEGEKVYKLGLAVLQVRRHDLLPPLRLVRLYVGLQVLLVRCLVFGAELLILLGLLLNEAHALELCQVLYLPPLDEVREVLHANHPRRLLPVVE